jgi:hypothetical protein
MRKLTFVLAAAVTALAGLIAPGAATAEGAEQGEVPCGILLPGVPPGSVATTGHFVVTPSGNGVLVCRAEIPEGPPETVVIDDLPCGTPAGPTTKSHTVITKSGRVILTCHVNPSA